MYVFFYQAFLLKFKFLKHINLEKLSSCIFLYSNIYKICLLYIYILLFFCNDTFVSCSTVWASLDLDHMNTTFHAVHGVLKARIWSGLPFPSLVDHVLSELFTMTYSSWMALHGMAHSFMELDKAVVHVINLISFLWLCFSFCLPSEG